MNFLDVINDLGRFGIQVIVYPGYVIIPNFPTKYGLVEMTMKTRKDNVYIKNYPIVCMEDVLLVVYHEYKNRKMEYVLPENWREAFNETGLNLIFKI